MESGNELIRRARGGDETALKVLLAQSCAGLRTRVAAKIPTDLQRLIDADDIVQETHIRVFRSIETLKNDRLSGFERWVGAIAVNRLRAEIHKQRTLKRGGAGIGEVPQRWDVSSLNLLDAIAASGETPSRIASTGEALAEVQAAMASLPGDCAKAIQSVYLEGRSALETATAMGRTERAVHGLCRRGLVKLRERLEKKSLLLSWT